MRRDPLLGESVVFVAHPQTRTFLPPTDLCPLCPSRPGRPSEVPDDHYQVVAFANPFRSLATGAEPVREPGRVADVPG